MLWFAVRALLGPFGMRDSGKRSETAFHLATVLINICVNRYCYCHFVLFFVCVRSLILTIVNCFCVYLSVICFHNKSLCNLRFSLFEFSRAAANTSLLGILYNSVTKNE